MKQITYLILTLFLGLVIQPAFAIKVVPTSVEKTEIANSGKRTTANKKQQRAIRKAERKAERKAKRMERWQKRLDRMKAKAAKKGKSLQSIWENKLFKWGIILLGIGIVLWIIAAILAGTLTATGFGAAGALWLLGTLAWLTGLVLTIIGIVQYTS